LRPVKGATANDRAAFVGSSRKPQGEGYSVT